MHEPTPSSTVHGGRLRRLVEFYAARHAAPEVSGAEVRTAAAFAARLRQVGASVTETVGGSGVVGLVTNGTGPVVMLRAELDALPIRENTDLAYASRVDGVMHACGHDLHLTAVLGATEILLDAAASWRGSLVIVGQPAEETLTGAEAMVADGLFERFPVPDIALAQHVAPLPVGVVAYGRELTVASTQFRVRLDAEPAHAAIQCWTEDVISALPVVQDRLTRVAQAHGATIAIGMIDSGSAANVLPRAAVLLGSARARTADVVTRTLTAAASEMRAMRGVRAVLEPLGGADAISTDRELVEDLIAEHTTAFGIARVWTNYTTNAADDFSVYGRPLPDGRQVRLGYWMFGGVHPRTWRQAVAEADDGPGPAIPGNHSDRFAPDLTSIRTAVVALATATRSQLAAHPAPDTEGAPS
jgi:amidohydrolase